MNRVLVQLSDLGYKKASIVFNKLDNVWEVRLVLARGVSSVIFIDDDEDSYLFYIYFGDKLITAGDYSISEIKQTLKIYE